MVVVVVIGGRVGAGGIVDIEMELLFVDSGRIEFASIIGLD